MNPKETARQSHLVLRALMTKPMTRLEIIEATGLEQHKITNRMKRLKIAGEVYISGWKRRDKGGKYMPVYSAGEGKDVPCKLQRKPKPQADKEYIQRLKKSGEIEHFRARRAVRLRVKKIVSRGVPAIWFAALPGAKA